MNAIPGRSHRGEEEPDAFLVSYPPLYNVAAHSPLNPGASSSASGSKSTSSPWTKTIYYEVRVAPSASAEEIPIALGFTAPPYPSFRLPGWHRASLAVHGDDGHRYVNDAWGGKEFLSSPFKRGEVLGLGMRFGLGAAGLGIRVEVFFTRNGKEVGSWDLHEEQDGQGGEDERGVEGLDGKTRDLCASVGVYGKGVDFDVVFDPASWVWKGMF